MRDQLAEAAPGAGEHHALALTSPTAGKTSGISIRSGMDLPALEYCSAFFYTGQYNNTG